MTEFFWFAIRKAGLIESRSVVENDVRIAKKTKVSKNLNKKEELS